MKPLVSSKILQTLKARMEGGEWTPGMRLPSLAALAQELGAGISTVREALRILEHRGYVAIEQGRGIFVRPASAWQPDPPPEPGVPAGGKLLSLFEFRNIVEPEMAALAAERGTPGQHRLIREAAAEMLEAVRTGADYFPSDIAFHDRIAEACGNEVMAGVMRGIADLLLESRRRTMRVKGSPERAAHYHMLIALAIEQLDAAAARQLMQLHLNDVQRDSLLLMEEENKP